MDAVRYLTQTTLHTFVTLLKICNHSFNQYVVTNLAGLCIFIRHARKHFSQAEGGQLDEVRQVMGMLAFPSDTHISPYKVTLTVRYMALFHACRAEQYQCVYQVSEQFEQNFTHGIPGRALFTICAHHACKYC